MERELWFREIQGNPKAPKEVMEKLAGLPLEEQTLLFRLEYCQDTTYWLDAREIHHPEEYHGDSVDFLGNYPVLVQDGAIVGIDISDIGWDGWKGWKGEELYWYVRPCSKVCSDGGHRTGWHYEYEEEHAWFIFRYLQDIPRSLVYPFR